MKEYVSQKAKKGLFFLFLFQKKLFWGNAESIGKYENREESRTTWSRAGPLQNKEKILFRVDWSRLEQ